MAEANPFDQFDLPTPPRRPPRYEPPGAGSVALGGAQTYPGVAAELDPWDKYEDAPSSHYDPPNKKLAPSSEPAQQQEPSTLKGVSRALEYGTPFVDRAVARAKTDLPVGYGGTGLSYAENLAAEQAKLEQWARDNQWTAYAAEAAGTAPLWMIPGPKFGLTGLGGRVASTATQGAAIGALQEGARSPDLTDIPETARRAAPSAVGGAAFGGAMPVVAHGVGKAVGRVLRRGEPHEPVGAVKGAVDPSDQFDRPAPGMAERGGAPGRQVPGEAAARPAAAVAGQPPPKPPGYVEGQAAAPGKAAEGGPAGPALPLHPSRADQGETLVGGGEEVPTAEIIRNPGMFGVGASPTNAAKIFAKPGKVNRFVLRKLENVFDRVEGAIKAKRTEVLNDLYKFGVSFRRHAGPSAGGPLRPIAGLNVSQEMLERTFRYGEGDPQIVLTPEEQRFFEEHVQPSRERGNALWEEVKALRKKVELTPDLYDEIEEMKPGFMHRRTTKSARQLLGLDERDPVTGYRSPGSKAPQEKPRKYFVIDDGKGNRLLVYKDQDRLYRASKTFQQGVLVKERMKGDFKPKRGGRINLAGREWRIDDALTREIEEQGGPEYVKDSIAATRLAELELTRTRDMLRGQLEAQQSLIDQGLASRSNNLPGTENWRKSNAPGFGGLYMPERIRKVVEARSDRLGPSTGENIVWDMLKLVNHKLVGTLFWNPVFHAANVAAHAYIERGFRNINPIANVHYVGHFREAMRDVAQQNENYRRALREGAVLMLGPRRANRMLTNLMFDGMKELQGTPQGVGLLKRIQNATGLPTDSIIGGYGRWAGDAMWQMGDILTMAAIKERQAIYRGESLAESIVKVHRELPTYRSPVESVLPGKAGRFIGGAFKDPAVNVAFSFTPYHENILRGMAMIGEDILEGAIHVKDPAARKAAGEAFGKIAAIAGALAVYKYGLDPIAQRMAGQDQMAKRFGPFAYLQLVMDYFEAKHLSRGAQTRLATGGLYSPSPLVEMGANLFAGEHAYSRSAIQPEWPFGSTKTDPLRGKGEGYKVPWSERFKAAAMSGLLPSSQLFEAVEDPRSGIQRALGLTQFRRKTEEEQAAASKARLAAPEYRAAAAVRKAARKAEKSKARHEDSMPQFSP